MEENKRKARPEGLVEHCFRSGGPWTGTRRARRISRLTASGRFENVRHFLHLPS
ncbi:hypothetical protein AOX55_00002046 [Sinorhizobium fredii CCBAU 25509]|nr:hypothetical protein SF83666_c17470 [Sinorhizobium fredii CCBAU 83666]AWM25298.1 hypothetical protein AOX55_00002046 [Sinorhizobium fredii CCBAU 25509]